MKKKVLAIVLCVATVMSMLTACGGKKSSSKGKLKVGLVTDLGGINDGSFNQSSWEGLVKAKKDLGIEAKYLESKTDADYLPNVESFIDDDYGLIIGVGYMLVDVIKETAEQNIDKKFVIVDDGSINASNVADLTFADEQSSYLVGYIAGKVTKTNTVGFVLGMAKESMQSFGYGYTAGVLDANENCKVEQYNANSFADPAIGKADANAAIANGADVIFHAAGGTGLGVIDACTEAGIYAIGVDIDQSSVAPKTVITSAMKRVDVAIYGIVKEFKKGKFKNGIYKYDVRDNGVDIAPTTNLIPDDLLKEVQGIKEDIKNGKIVVPSTKKEFEKKYGNVYKLDD